MHAASREALANATLNLDNTLSGIDNAVVVAAQTGTEISTSLMSSTATAACASQWLRHQLLRSSALVW